MQVIRNITGRIFALWALLLFTGTMLLIWLPVWLLRFLPEPIRTHHFIRISRLWMAVFLPLSGCPLTIRGREHFQRGNNYVVVCNHNSFMDVPVSSPGIPGANKTIAKIEMASIPLFGIIYQRGSVLVDRQREESRAQSYADMKEVLRMGMHMCIYPEGTRNKTAQPLKEFKDGAFRLAIEMQKDVIPAVIFNTRNVLPSDKFFYFHPSPLQLHFLEPVSTAGLSANDAKALKEKVFRIMWNYIEQQQKITD